MVCVGMRRKGTWWFNVFIGLITKGLDPSFGKNFPASQACIILFWYTRGNCNVCV